MRPRTLEDRSSLVAITFIWLGVVAWLALGYFGQTQPGGPYTEAFRKVFTTILVVLIPIVSSIFVVAWAAELRKRDGSDRPT